MRKLYNLKSWYTLEDAAERLSETLREPVCVKDLMQLASEGHLTLSWQAHIQGLSREEVERFELKINKTKIASDDGIHPKERESLLRLVIGMAIDGYGYDPKASRSPIPKEIANNLMLHGIRIDDDTVRKWLNQAKESYSPAQDII